MTDYKALAAELFAGKEIEFKDIRIGDVVAWGGGAGVIISTVDGMHPDGPSTEMCPTSRTRTFYLIDRLKPELPTEPGAVILVRVAVDAGRFDTPATAFRGGGVWNAISAQGALMCFYPHEILDWEHATVVPTSEWEAKQ